MYQLVKVTDRTYYLDGPSRIGIYRYGENEVICVDSGNEEAAGQALVDVLKEQGWTLKALLNTHSLPDHIVGNKVIADATGCPVYAKDVECGFLRHTMVTGSYMVGGYPVAPLRNPVFMPGKVDAVDFVNYSFPEGVEWFPLKGHFFDMAGIKTPDEVYFIADMVSDAETLAKKPIPYVFDVREYLAALDRLKEMKGRLFVPAVAPVTDDIAPLAELNRKQVEKVIDQLLAICAEAKTTDDVMKEMFDVNGLEMDWNEYAWTGSAIRSYLAYLSDSGKARTFFKENTLYWQTV